MTATTQRQVTKKIDELYVIAHRLYPELIRKHKPELKFSNRMTSVSGKICYELPTHRPKYFMFSNPIMNLNSFDDYENTVIHEFAHIVCLWLYKSPAHDYKFYNIMAEFGSTNPNRCHTLKTPSNTPVHDYRCTGCGTVIKLTEREHRSHKRGRCRYHVGCSEYVLRYEG